MINQDTDRLAYAREQGQLQFDSIVELVTALRDQEGASETDAYDAAEQAVHESALSVEVRGGWYDPSLLAHGYRAQVPAKSQAASKPAEYSILLCTGGPAVRLVGTLSDSGEPETATLEVQDWFTPWAEFSPVYRNSHNVGLQLKAADWRADCKARDEILLAYASRFFFGE